MKEETNGAKSLKQDQIIVALLENPTNERAASALGIGTVTLWRYMKCPGFSDAFRRARREAFSQSVARLQHASNAAVGTLLRVMTDKDAAASSRVRAAEIVLNTSFRALKSKTSKHASPSWRNRRRMQVNEDSNETYLGRAYPGKA